ncbi:MAG: HAD-IA family hydrolase [Acidimicrobiales bacterium]|nr:HAD-IA family hydrolase [Acidimicrobiales bacterium]MDP6299276.1 HAD-IA family hydrolase [Acidimicrobiales bacterium]HJM97954.1 HAD-IA family hydrolase [Acidimicrobiales bacterium]
MRCKSLTLFSGLVALLFFVAGCNLQLRVVIDVEKNGSGTVTAGVGLDVAAREQVVFQDLETVLQTSDLANSGWGFQNAGRGADGRDWFEATKSFSNSEDLQTVLNELTSSNKTFKDWEIQTETSEKKRSYSVIGNVDLTEGFEIFTDTALNDLLEEPPLGISRETLEETLGVPLEDTVSFRVVVNLPDDSDGKTFDIPLGEQRIIDASGESEHRIAQVLDWVVWAIIALLILSIILALLNWYLDLRFEKKRLQRRPTSVTQQIPGVEGENRINTPNSDPQLQLLVMDLHGVIFKQGMDPQEHLRIFIESNGGEINQEDLAELHREGTLGRVETSEFWKQVGVPGNTEDIDKKYLESFSFRTGAKDFLRNLHKRGIAVSVVTNDFATWSYGLRDMYGLQGVNPWIVSAETGVRKPDPAAFEILYRASGHAYQSCLVLDNATNLLDTAAVLGMKTALFNPDNEPTDNSKNHPTVKKLNEFFRRQ